MDYLNQNEVTIPDSYPILCIDDCIESLGDSKLYYALDIKLGYWQIPLPQEDRYKRTFVTNCGAFRCIRIPFGLRHIPTTFKRSLDLIRSDISVKTCLDDLADVRIFSR